MTSYVEDLPLDLLPEEIALFDGITGATHLTAISEALGDALLTTPDARIGVRAIFTEALSLEPGVMFHTHFDPRTFAKPFATRRRTYDVDADMQIHYGRIPKVLDEIYALGLEQPYGEFWLDYFLKDNAVYRVNVSACLCVAGAILASGTSSRLGVPTPPKVLT